jgi:ABC-type Fe3+-siderophore transport system permease subunit
VVADFLSQKVIHGGELPVGAVTAVLGAPVLLMLLRRSVYRI